MTGIRIGGLASGMDIDQLVKDMMKAHRIPVDKMYQKKQSLEWQRTAYRDMHAKISDYRDNKLSNYRLEGTWLSKKIDVTNSAAVSAKATSSTQNGTVSVDVVSLATAASNQSSADIRSDATFDPSKTLGSQDAKLVGNFTQTAGVYDKYEFEINGTKITVDPNVDSLDAVIKRINQTTNVSAFYDSVTGKVSFSSKNTGLVNGPTKNGDKITFVDLNSGDFLLNTLKVTTAAGTPASKAEVKINGLTTTRDSNTFTVNGVELTLLQKSNGVASQITVGTDVDNMIETVKSFIEDYNDLLKTINDKKGETKYRDFLPLTDEQKKDMKDKEIELWEEKAKSGLLKNDSILSSAAGSMRSISIGKVETGSTLYKTLSSIGIKTGVYEENGKLYLDEIELRKAIETDPDAVRNLFAGSGNGDSDTSDVGLAKRLYDDLKISLDRINKKAGFPSSLDSSSKDSSLLGSQLYDLKRELDGKESRLKDIENRYYRQFTAMEAAINRYNQQAAYLANSFGGAQ